MVLGQKNSGDGNRFFRISGKTGSRIQNFLGQKPPPDQDGANKKVCQIGPAVPEEIDYMQTSCCYIIEIGNVLYYFELVREI